MILSLQVVDIRAKWDVVGKTCHKTSDIQKKLLFSTFLNNFGVPDFNFDISELEFVTLLGFVIFFGKNTFSRITVNNCQE